MRALVVVVCFALLAPAAASAAGDELAGDPAGARIVDVVVEGAADEADAESARAVFGLGPGDRYDAGAVRLGVRRVFLTGPWADVRIYKEESAAGVKLFLVVTPDLLVGEVVVDGGGLPADRLRAATGLSAGDRFRPEAVERARAAVEKAAAELGYPQARVRVAVVPRGASEQRVEIDVDPGQPTLIERVVLKGDPAMAEGEVLDRLGVRKGEPFDRLALEAGMRALKKLFVERRHLGARAEILEARYGDDERSVALRLLVDAGPRYRVDFVGNRVVPHATLKAIMNERRIDSTERGALLRADDQLEEYYRDEGYARVAVRFDDVPAYPPWDRDAERVLRFHIDEGPRVEVREIVVEGTVARDGRQIAADIWAFITAETPDGGLVQRMDQGDLEDLFGRGPGSHDDEERALEYPDTLLVPVSFTLPLILLPRVDRTPRYTKALFEAARQHVVDRYRKAGFLSASVIGPEPIWLDGGSAVRVRFRVHEGTETRIAGVRFEPAPTLPLGELLTKVALEPGQPADLYAIEETRLVLEQNLRERGFPFATVAEELVRLEAGLADVVYRIDEGPRVRIGEVRVAGNRMTRDFVVKDAVALKSGHYYSSSAIEQSRQRLLRTGLFTSVSIGFLDDKPDAKTRDLLVEVHERPRWSVEAGGGGSLEDGPRAFASVESRNILGFGFGVRGRGQLNYPRALYDFLYDENDPTSPLHHFDDEPALYRWLLFTEGQAVLTAEIPKLYVVPFDTRLHLDAVGLREIRPAFTLFKGSVSFGVDMRPFSWLHLGPQLEVEASDFNCATLTEGQSCGEGSSVLTRRVDAGALGQTTLRALATVDWRDDPFRPHAGFYTSLSADLAGGAGQLRNGAATVDVQSNFLKLAGVASGYVPLAPNVTLALTLRGGNIFGLPTTNPATTNYVPLFKRFYLGGSSSIRGFRTDAIVPVDDEEYPAARPPEGPMARRYHPFAWPDATPTSLGGNVFVNGRTELRLGLFGDLELGIFLDAGQLANDATRMQLAGFAIGSGFGFRYNTPVGPFAVDIGWQVIDAQRPLPLITSLERLNLHLSIGYF